MPLLEGTPKQVTWATSLRVMLLSALCVDKHDEWTCAERRYMSQEAMELLSTQSASIMTLALVTGE